MKFKIGFCVQPTLYESNLSYVCNIEKPLLCINSISEIVARMCIVFSDTKWTGQSGKQKQPPFLFNPLYFIIIVVTAQQRSITIDFEVNFRNIILIIIDLQVHCKKKIIKKKQYFQCLKCFKYRYLWKIYYLCNIIDLSTTLLMLSI